MNEHKIRSLITHRLDLIENAHFFSLAFPCGVCKPHFSLIPDNSGDTEMSVKLYTSGLGVYFGVHCTYCTSFTRLQFELGNDKWSFNRMYVLQSSVSEP